MFWTQSTNIESNKSPVTEGWMTSIDNVATKIFSIFGLIFLTHATTMSFIAKHITQKSQGLARAFSLHNIKTDDKIISGKCY